MNQEINSIEINKLMLWTGNLREAMDESATYIVIKDKLSLSVPNIIRMPLRQLFGAATKDSEKERNMYLQNNFSCAKEKYDQNTKAPPYKQNVTEKAKVQWMQTGASNYLTSTNIGQNEAISINLDLIITITHEQGEDK